MITFHNLYFHKNKEIIMEGVFVAFHVHTLSNMIKCGNLNKKSPFLSGI
jgi:hypothetical protein